MRMIILAAGAALALSACGGGGTEANQTDLAVNNLVVEELDTANATMNADAMNMSDADHANMVMNDTTTNDADTNLANGM